MRERELASRGYVIKLPGDALILPMRSTNDFSNVFCRLTELCTLLGALYCQRQAPEILMGPEEDVAAYIEA
jgi:hypothetical protein